MSDIESLQAEVKRLQSELQTLDVGGEKITISEYLLKRLEQLGVKVCTAFILHISPLHLDWYSICLVCPAISILLSL